MKQQQDGAWRRFPQIESMYESGQMPALMERIERTCRQLDELIRNGTQDQQQRAGRALAAYGRTLDLLRLLEEEAAKTAPP